MIEGSGSIGTAFVDLLLNDTEYKSKLKTVETSASNTATAIMSSFRRVAGVLGIALGVGTLIAYGKECVLLAARVETLAVVLKEVGKNAGYTTQQTAMYVEQVKKMGITTQAARNSVILMAQSEMDLSKAAQFARIAQDAAVIGNINSSESMQRMVYAVKAGQTEILRTMGLNVSFEQSYAKLATTLNKSAAALNESEKVQARMNAVIEYGVRIQGVYEASLTSAGKAMLSLDRYVEEVKYKLGTAFQPALKLAVDALTESFKEMGKSLDDFITSGNMEKMATSIANGAAIIVKFFMDVTTFAGSAATAIYKFKDALLSLLAGIATYKVLILLAGGVVSLGAAIVAATVAITLFGIALYDKLFNSVEPAIASIDRLKKSMESLGSTELHKLLRDQVEQLEALEAAGGTSKTDMLERMALRSKIVDLKELIGVRKEEQKIVDKNVEINEQLKKDQEILANKAQLTAHINATALANMKTLGEQRIANMKREAAHDLSLTKDRNAGIIESMKLEEQLNRTRSEDSGDREKRERAIIKKTEEFAIEEAGKVRDATIAAAKATYENQKRINAKIIADREKLTPGKFSKSGEEGKLELAATVALEKAKADAIAASDEKVLAAHRAAVTAGNSIDVAGANKTIAETVRAGAEAIKNYNILHDAEEKKWDQQVEGHKVYERMIEDQADFAITENERAVNQIVASYDKKLRVLNELQEAENSGLKYEEYMRLKLLLLLEKENALMQQAITNASNEASFYQTLIGYETTYYNKKLAYIEAVRKQNAKLYGEEAANAGAKQAIGDLDQELFSKKAAQVEAALGQMAAYYESASSYYAKGSKEYEAMQRSAKGMIVLQQAVALANAVAAVANQASSGDPYTAWARIAMMIVAMNSLLSAIGGSLNAAGSGGGGERTYGKSYGQDTTVLGGENTQGSESISRSWEILQDTYDMENAKLSGIYKEMKDLNQNLTGLITGIVRMGAGTFEGFDTGEVLNFNPNFSIWEKLFGGSVVCGINKFLFGSSQSYTSGAGIRIGAGIAGEQDITGYRRTTTEKKGAFGGLFGGNSTSTSESAIALSNEVTDLLTKVFKNFSKTFEYLAKGFGTDADAALNYMFPDIDWDLQGKTAEEINKYIRDQISAIGDTAVASLFGELISQYQQVGEGLLETAVRLVSEKESILSALDMTNMSFDGTAMEAVALSQELIVLAGSLDNFMEAVSTYYDKFFTDAEKQVKIQEQLAGTFSDMDMTLPATRDGFRAIVEGLDLTTESGREAYVTLLSLADSADEYYSFLEDRASQKADQEISILAAQGKSYEALSAQRERDLALMDESLQAGQRQINQLEDYWTTVDLNLRLLQAQGKSVEALAFTRKREMEVLSDTDAAILQQIYDQEDLNATQDLNLRLLQAQGKSVEALAFTRKREMEVLSDTDAAILQQIHDQEDLNAVNAKTADWTARLNQLTMSDDAYKEFSIQSEFQDMLNQIDAMSNLSAADRERLIDLATDIRDASLEQLEQDRAVAVLSTLTAIGDLQREIRDEYARGSSEGSTLAIEQAVLASNKEMDNILKQFYNLGYNINPTWATNGLTDQQQEYFDMWIAIRARREEEIRLEAAIQAVTDKMEFEVPLLEALGYAEEALAEQRMKELMGLTETQKTMQLQTWVAEDATAAMEKYGNRIKQISDLVDELSKGSLAPVQSAQVFDLSYEKKRAAAMAAGATDEDISNYLSYVQEYLSFQRAYGGDYQKIYDAMMADLNTLGDSATDSYNVAEAQLDTLKMLNQTLIADGISQLAALNTLIELAGGNPIPAHGSGGLTRGLTISGEMGREWNVPTYEPQRSSFLRDMGVDTEKIGEAIARNIQVTGNSSGDVYVSVQIDGKEIGKAVAKQIPRNPDLSQAISKVRRAA